MRHCFGVVFFFQAEDGIRYLVRSRGLGDVYKRQRGLVVNRHRPNFGFRSAANDVDSFIFWIYQYDFSVSYTHLTLPTSDLV